MEWPFPATSEGRGREEVFQNATLDGIGQARDSIPVHCGHGIQRAGESAPETPGVDAAGPSVGVPDTFAWSEPEPS